MKIIKQDKNLILTDIKDFSLQQTLECGQCFHFKNFGEGEFAVVYKKNLLHAKEENDKIILYNLSLKDFENIWKHYFDLERDYGSIKKAVIKSDKRLNQAVNDNYGVHILNAEFSETLMSFIISQNKQIPHIKKIVADISKEYGTFLGKINEEEFYSFPDVSQMKDISEDDYSRLKTGFRAKYLRDAAQKMANDTDMSYEVLNKMGYEKAKDKLTTIKGVGDKVANCVLLYSLGYRNAFPVDVWIKRIMEHLYFENDTKNEVIYEFAKEKFGEYGGYAQQYLFYYARSNGIGKK